jgi:transposase
VVRVRVVRPGRCIFDVPDMHVLDVEIDDEQRLVLTVESDQLEGGCPACGLLAAGHGRRVRSLHDAPCFGRVTVLRWLVRMWRCREPLCPRTTFTESHDLAPPRMVLTTRAVDWATSALSWDDTTVSALARQLGVDWHTCWDRAVTIMVDLARDQDGCVHARLLDAVVGRSGAVYKAW